MPRHMGPPGPKIGGDPHACDTGTIRSCAGVNIKQTKPILVVAVQLQKHVSSNQFHSQGRNMSQVVAGGSGLRRSRRLLEEIVLKLDDENINCDDPFLRVHISSFRQIGVYYKAMILELYILHAVGRVCMAI